MDQAAVSPANYSAALSIGAWNRVIFSVYISGNGVLYPITLAGPGALASSPTYSMSFAALAATANGTGTLLFGFYYKLIRGV